MLGVTQQTIRLYEQRGFLHPRRTSGNTRLFTDKDVKILRFIRDLTRDMGVNLAGVEIILRLKREIDRMQMENRQLMDILTEAAGYLRDLMDARDDTSLPVRSIMGKLVKIVRIG